MKLEDLIIRVEELIKKGQQVLDTRQSDGLWTSVDSSKFADFRTSSLAFLRRVFGEESPNFREFDERVRDNSPSDVERGIGILMASKEELEGGWLVTTKGLLSAEIFSDFLEMAEHLLAEGYKDAAAVIVGSVLEGHLRQLAQRHRIGITVQKAGKQVPRACYAL